jgi:hypothetical protein
MIASVEMYCKRKTCKKYPILICNGILQIAFANPSHVVQSQKKYLFYGKPIGHCPLQILQNAFIFEPFSSYFRSLFPPLAPCPPLTASRRVVKRAQPAGRPSGPEGVTRILLDILWAPAAQLLLLQHNVQLVPVYAERAETE